MDRVLTLHLAGALTGTTAPRFVAAVETLLDSMIQVVIDLRDVDVLEPSGIAALVQMARTCRGQGRQLVLTSPQLSLRRALTSAGLPVRPTNEPS